MHKTESLSFRGAPNLMGKKQTRFKKKRGKLNSPSLPVIEGKLLY